MNMSNTYSVEKDCSTAGDGTPLPATQDVVFSYFSSTTVAASMLSAVMVVHDDLKLRKPPAERFLL